MLRWIEEIAAVVARMLRGRGAGDLDLARARVEQAIEHLLGPLSGLVPKLETESVVELLHDPDRLYGYARLLALEAAIGEARGDPSARADRRRAVELAAAALDRAAEPPSEWRAWIDAARGEP